MLPMSLGLGERDALPSPKLKPLKKRESKATQRKKCKTQKKRTSGRVEEEGANPNPKPVTSLERGSNLLSPKKKNSNYFGFGVEG